MTGLDVDVTILVEGLIFGIMFAVTVFCLSRQFGLRTEYSILAMFFASVAPRFVDNSYWNGGARAPFVVLAVLLVLVAIKAGTTRQTQLYILIPPLLTTCFAVHHMAVLLLLFGVAYLLSTVVFRASSSNLAAANLRRHKRLTASVILLCLLVSVVTVSVFFLTYFEKEVITGFEKTSLFDLKPAYLSATLNVAASYINQIGFVLILAVLGSVAILRKFRISSELLFLMTSLIVFIPMLSNALYISMLLTPFIAILGAIWISVAMAGRRRSATLVLVAILIISSIVLPVWSVSRWNHVEELSGDTVQGDPQLFNDGTYMKEYAYKTNAISNVDVVGSRLAAVSGIMFLWMGVESALSGDVSRESIEHNLTWGHQDFPKNLYIWFEYEGGPRIDFLVIVFFLQGASFPAGSGDDLPSGEGYYETHSRLLVVIDNRWPSDFVWVWGKASAMLPAELSSCEWTDVNSKVVYTLPSYMIYQSQRTSLYAVEVPG